MNADLVDILCCPRCGGAVALSAESLSRATSQVEQGELGCRVCKSAFPIVGGIARFVSRELYAASFGHQWNRFEVQAPEEDAEVFRTKTGVDPQSLAGLRVLDGGCGSGRYSAVAARAGARVVAVDLSRAVEKAAAVCGGMAHVDVLQADLLALPLVPESFDFAFSLGVLHHSPDARRAFGELARRVRPGGRLAVWLYRRNTAAQEAVNQVLRGMTTRMSVGQLETVSQVGAVLGGVPMVKWTLNKVVNFSNHPQWEVRLCDTFDWYSPRYQSHHTSGELRGWFEEEGFAEVRELEPAKTGGVYRWAYEHDLIIGSGVNFVGKKR